MQRRYINWQDQRKSDIVNRRLLAAIPNGLWRGFDYDASSSGTNLVLSHTVTGYNETAEDGTAHNNVGMVKTQQGVIVTEDAAVTIILSGNSDLTHGRIDYIIMSETYVETPGGTVAGYAQLIGTPAATPVPPAIPFPLTSTILGTVVWPANTVNIAAAAYTKAAQPVIGGGDAGGSDVVLKSIVQTITARKQIVHEVGKAAAMVNTAGTLTATVDSNYYLLPNTDNNYDDVSNISVPYSGNINHFKIRTLQKLRIKVDGNIFFTANLDSVVHVEANEVLEFIDLNGNGYGTPKYLMIHGSEVRRDGGVKLFGALIGNKTNALYPTPNALLLSLRGNFCEVTLSYTTVNSDGGIKLLSGTDSFWDNVNANTKGGNVTLIKFNDNSSANAGLIIASGGISTGVYKPLVFADGNTSKTVGKGGTVYMRVVEEETVFTVLDVYAESMWKSTGIVWASPGGALTSAANFGSPKYDVAYCLKGNEVALCGAIAVVFSGAGGNIIMLTLPVGLRPAKLVFLPATPADGLSVCTPAMYIDTSGNLTVGASGAGSGTILLDGLRFRLS